jgi:hypothetical protein
MDELSREKKESMDEVHGMTSTTAAADHDMINGLPDDPLLRILSFLLVASEVARTSNLSRWRRHLWPNAMSLRLIVVRELRSYNEVDDDIDDSCLVIVATCAILERRVEGPDDVEQWQRTMVARYNTCHTLCFYMVAHCSKFQFSFALLLCRRKCREFDCLRIN